MSFGGHVRGRRSGPQVVVDPLSNKCVWGVSIPCGEILQGILLMTEMFLLPKRFVELGISIGLCESICVNGIEIRCGALCDIL